MFRRNLLTLALFCTAIFFVGMTGYGDAGNPNSDPTCEGLSGAAYGLCTAAIAIGCYDSRSLQLPNAPVSKKVSLK